MQSLTVSSKLIESKALPFMTDERLQVIRAEFADLVVKYQRDDLSDVRKRAILTSLEQHLQLVIYSNRPQGSLNQVYLGLPDNLLTLKWKVFRALTRSAISVEEQQRLDNQRQWMRDYINALPAYLTFSNTTKLAELDKRFADPLCAIYDRPLNKAKFAEFKNRLQKRGDRKTQLAFVVSHMLYASLFTQFDRNSNPTLPFDDHPLGCNQSPLYFAA